MTSVLKYYMSFSVCVAVLLVNGCKSHPPLIEICIVTPEHLVCNDPRLPKDEQDYIRSFEESENYIATSPHDYQITQEWVVRKCRGRK